MREWLTELTKALFSEATGLFKQTKAQNDIAYFPSSKAKHIYDLALACEYFRFAGQVVAKALFEKIPIPFAKVNKVLLKRLTKPTQDTN